MQLRKEKLTNVVAMLVVKKAPVHCHECVQDAHAAVEWELGYLCSRYLAKGIAKFGDCGVFVDVEALGEETIVASLLDAISDRAGGFEMNSLGEDEGTRFFGGIFCQYKFT